MRSVRSLHADGFKARRTVLALLAAPFVARRVEEALLH
jgi:hypothetical protein